MQRAVPDDEVVDDAGGEVQRDVGLAVDDADAVPVPVAGPGHAAAEQQEGRPGHTHTHTFKFSSVCRGINV